MHFVMASMALAMTPTAAEASDSVAMSRAIPPVEEVAVAAFAPSRSTMTDLVYRPGASAAAKAPTAKPAIVGPRNHDEAQRTCLAQAVYYESKGEPLKGQHAVADVVINRTKRKGFASTPCGVIRQKNQFTNAARWKIPSLSDPLWQRAREVAANALQGVGTVSTVITHFHAARVRPGWNMRRLASIGGHVFY